MILQAAKTARVVATMAQFAGHTVVGRRPIEGEVARRRYYTEQTSRYCRTGLGIMDVEVETVGFDPEVFKRSNYLLVGNHMSYLDVIVLASKLPCVFVTSVDMGEQPVLGDLAKMGGCIFVERRNRSQVERDLSAMSNALRDGFNVAIYPEGTSTDGQRVLPFKKTLLMSAVEAGRNIQPFCLRYLEIDGKPFSSANADVVCWYGKADFAGHLVRLMGAKSVRAELKFLEPIHVSKESTRDELAAKCYSVIEAAYFEGRESLRAPAAN